MVNFADQKQMVVWSSVITGFNLVVHKSNIVLVKRVHNTVHNTTRSDVHYAEGVMIIHLRWSKTNQYGEETNVVPLISKNHSPICAVRWLLYMIDNVPAEGFHNLFSYIGKQGVVVLITYHDLMVNLRDWLDLIGEDSKMFSSHSLQWGATTHVHQLMWRCGDVKIQRLGHWKSQCYKNYIQDDIAARVNTCFKFNSQ